MNEEDSSYSLTKNIVEDLENNLESLFQRLTAYRKKSLSVPPDVLAKIIEHPKLLSPSKVLAIHLLRFNLDHPKQKEEVSLLMCSIKFMFRVSEILKKDLEEHMENETTDPPSHTSEILEILSEILAKQSQAQKDTIAAVMEESGIFILANVWCSSFLLKMYSSLLSGTALHHEEEGKKGRAPDSTPYRVPVEENIYGLSSILVHRRKPAYFMPKFFKMEPVANTKIYIKIFGFQDEYEIVHKSLMSWCSACGDLKGVEWVSSWHLQNLSIQMNNITYEKEILFVLGAMFYSSVQNTLTTEILENTLLFRHYLELIKKCKASKNPAIKGSSSVASQRLTSQCARFFMSTILSSKSTQKQKTASLLGLRALCDVLDSTDLTGVKKSIEKQAACILELVEIEPEYSVTLHCTSIICVLCIVDKIPLSLFAPSKLSLVLWMIENAKIRDMKAKHWLTLYMNELVTVYNPLENDCIVRALGF